MHNENDSNKTRLMLLSYAIEENLKKANLTASLEDKKTYKFEVFFEFSSETAINITTPC